MLSLLCRLSGSALGIIVRRDDAAAGNFKSVHDDEAAGGDDFRMHVERHRALGAQGQFRHFVAADENFDRRAEMVSSVEESMTFSMDSISHSTSWVASLSL